jgi:hypothetical protein
VDSFEEVGWRRRYAAIDLALILNRVARATRAARSFKPRLLPSWRQPLAYPSEVLRCGWESINDSQRQEDTKSVDVFNLLSWAEVT